MLPRVAIHRFCCALAKALRGVRVCHLNSAGHGGGVAEALSRDVPLARALAIGADWRLIQKALVSLLAGNFGELLVTLLAGVVGLPLPLLPLQLL